MQDIFKIMIKNFIQKNWVLIGFVITTAIDTSTGFLESLELDGKVIAIIRFLGAIILAYKTQYNFGIESKSISLDNTDPVRPERPKTRR